MNLYELGREYLEQSELLRSQIKRLRPQLKTLSGIELLELRRRLSMLYKMASDCKITGEKLQNYYN